MTNKVAPVDPAFQKPFDKAEFDEQVKLETELKGQLEEAANRVLDKQTADKKPNIQDQAVLLKEHDVLEAKYNRQKEHVEKLRLRHPENVAEMKTNRKENEVFHLMDRYLRCQTDQEVAQLIADKDFEILKGDGSSVAKIPANSVHLGPQMTAAAVRSDNSTGQNAVQTNVFPGIVDRLKYRGSMARMAYTFSTGKGGDFVIPRVDNSDVEGEILTATGKGQGTTSTVNNGNDIGKVTLETDTVGSGIIPVTMEMIQDSEFPIVPYYENQAVRRISITSNKAMTRGATGTKFEGIMTVAKSALTSSTRDGIDRDEFIEIVYDIDEAYFENDEGLEGGMMDMQQGQGVVGWMVHRDVKKLLMQLEDSDGRPLWQVNMREGEPATLLGFPIYVNNNLDPVGNAGAKPLVFGNIGHYAVRRVTSISVYNFFDSLTARDNERHIMAYQRIGGKHRGPVDSSNNADALRTITMA